MVLRPPHLVTAAAAFTLVELVTVMAIISVLTAIVIGAGRHTLQAGEVARTKAELSALSVALEAYRKKYGDYPQTGAPEIVLQSLMGKRGPEGAVLHDRALMQLSRFSITGSTDSVGEPSASATLIDPWSQPYQYVYHGGAGTAGSSFELYSTGPDKLGASPSNTGAEALDNVYAAR
jgi:prepilin-type N-terminal cleavage/methylation domain-containing protein